MTRRRLLVTRLLLRRRVVIIGMLLVWDKVILIRRTCRRLATRGLLVRPRSLMRLRCLLHGRRGGPGVCGTFYRLFRCRWWLVVPLRDRRTCLRVTLFVLILVLTCMVRARRRVLFLFGGLLRFCRVMLIKSLN